MSKTAKTAIALLTADHEVVRELLTKLTATTSRAGKTRRELLERIAEEIRIHAAIEEELFYPALREAGGSDAAKMFFEATEEHRAVEELVLPDLENTEVQSDQFSGRAKVLKELVEHHADEEEEEMFPMAKEVLGAKELRELGERMEERRKELKKNGVSVA
jgi:hemerythrin-like domain-containing protein